MINQVDFILLDYEGAIMTNNSKQAERAAKESQREANEEALREIEEARLQRQRDARVQNLKAEMAQTRNVKREKGDQKFIAACKKLQEAGVKIIEEGQRGYDTWVAAMSSAVALGRLIVELNLGRQILVGLSKIEIPIIKARIPTPESVIDNKLAENSIPAVGKDCVLPELHYFVEFGSDNKLKFPDLMKNIRLSNGEPMTEKLQESLRESMKPGMIGWLDQQGYTVKPGTTDEFVSKADNTPLDQPTFNALRDNLSKDMDDYLTEQLGVKMGHVPVEKDDVQQRPQI
jgi:hypothetical protein